MKDLTNTFNKRPENFTENLERATGTYTNIDSAYGLAELKNKEFVQMYKAYQAELVELAITAPTANAILLLMSVNMDINNTYIVAQKDIAEALHKSVDMVKKSIRTLKDRDFITTYKVNKQNVYFINPRIFCKVSGSYKQKLIGEYTKINEEKEYAAQQENVDLSKITKPNIHIKHEFETAHRELSRPTNQQVFEMNKMKEVLNKLDIADKTYLKRKYIAEDIPTDKEMEAFERSFDLVLKKEKVIRQEARKYYTSEEAEQMERLENQESWIKDKMLQEIEEREQQDSGKDIPPKEPEQGECEEQEHPEKQGYPEGQEHSEEHELSDEETTRLFYELYNPDDPFGIFKNAEADLQN